MLQNLSSLKQISSLRNVLPLNNVSSLKQFSSIENILLSEEYFPGEYLLVESNLSVKGRFTVEECLLVDEILLKQIFPIKKILLSEKFFLGEYLFSETYHDVTIMVLWVCPPRDRQSVSCL